MTITITQIKIVHTVIFWVLSGCVLYALYGGLANLTLLAERLGAASGSVADIFLPKWFADRIFPICGTTYLIACILLVARLIR